MACGRIAGGAAAIVEAHRFSVTEIVRWEVQHRPAHIVEPAPEPSQPAGAAFGLEATDPAGFEDVANVASVSDIDAPFAAGLTAGCAAEPLLYCPKQLTTRDQMAAFLNPAGSN